MSFQSLTEHPTSLYPCKRYILSHNPSGTSIIHSSPAQIYHGRDGVGGMARSYAIDKVPVNLTADADVAAYMDKDDKLTGHLATDIVVPNGTGVNMVVVDLAPGGESQMHRTVSIDFSICVVGDIEMELDGGEVVKLKPGDHVIQRGTMHRWVNASKTEPARFIGITMPCIPFDIAGKMLAEDHVKGTGAVQKDGSRL